jgi:hypothetical protein
MLTLADAAAQPAHAVEHELHALPLVRPQPPRQHGVHIHGRPRVALRRLPQHQRLPWWRPAILPCVSIHRLGPHKARAGAGTCKFPCKPHACHAFVGGEVKAHIRHCPAVPGLRLLRHKGPNDCRQQRWLELTAAPGPDTVPCCQLLLQCLRSMRSNHWSSDHHGHVAMACSTA